MTDAYYMRLAITEAKKAADMGEVPVGAVIVDSFGEVISTAHNLRESLNDPTAHAEILAIRDAAKKLKTHDLSGCEIYTTCYPCPMCMSAIIWANIKKVYYGNTRKEAGLIGFRDRDIFNFIKYSDKDGNDYLNLESMDHDETIETFNKFVEKKDKDMY